MFYRKILKIIRRLAKEKKKKKKRVKNFVISVRSNSTRCDNLDRIEEFTKRYYEQCKNCSHFFCKSKLYKYVILNTFRAWHYFRSAKKKRRTMWFNGTRTRKLESSKSNAIFEFDKKFELIYRIIRAHLARG